MNSIKKRISAVLLALLFALCLLPAPAGAAGTVYYRGANGETVACTEYTMITEDTVTLGTGCIMAE